jgi:hypothetical protein
MNGNRTVELGSIQRSVATGLVYNGSTININGTVAITLQENVNGFAGAIGNIRAAAGGHAFNVAAGANTDNDVSSVYFNFITPGSNQAGAIVRADTGGGSGWHVNYATSSDLRLKPDHRDTVKGLKELVRLRVIDWGERGVQGLGAQNVGEVYPEAAVVGDDDPNVRPWMVDYGRLTPLLIRAVQELSRKVEELESRVGV